MANVLLAIPDRDDFCHAPYDVTVTFAADLADWTDWDVAAYHLGLHLGALPGDFATENKAVFWTDNPLGNGLHDALLALERAGVLERREEPDEQFRWRPPLGDHAEGAWGVGRPPR